MSLVLLLLYIDSSRKNLDYEKSGMWTSTTKTPIIYMKIIIKAEAKKKIYF